jgi:hypothetical protein
MALTLYFVLAAGHIRSTTEEEKRRASGEQGRQGSSIFGSWERTPEEVKVCDGLEKIASEMGVKSITARKWLPCDDNRLFTLHLIQLRSHMFFTGLLTFSPL